MNLTAPLLLLLALMGRGCSSPTCPEDCDAANYTTQYFNHVSELQDNPMAPWELELDRKSHREPESIQYAKCKPCKVSGMTSKPIWFQISVYETVWEGTDTQLCRCPFNLAVGCTCVK